MPSRYECHGLSHPLTAFCTLLHRLYSHGKVYGFHNGSMILTVIDVVGVVYNVDFILCPLRVGNKRTIGRVWDLLYFSHLVSIYVNKCCQRLLCWSCCKFDWDFFLFVWLLGPSTLPGRSVGHQTLANTFLHTSHKEIAISRYVLPWILSFIFGACVLVNIFAYVPVVGVQV